MSETDELLKTLRAKAMLLIQRERELYALRLGRERMLAWLHAFHRLSVDAPSRPLAGMCAEWATIMIEQLHFQTAVVYSHPEGSGELELVHGVSHGDLAPRLSIDAALVQLIAATPEGLHNGSTEPAAPGSSAKLAEALGLQRFLWFDFTLGNQERILLAAGVAQGVSASHAALSSDDLADFTMLGRHLAVLLSNATLIGALETTRAQLQNLFDHMRQAILTFDASGQVGPIVSRQAKQVFSREQLSGSNLRELLFPGAPAYDVDASAFSEWVDLVFSTPEGDWERLEKYAPREALLPSATGAALPLALEFRPLLRAGAIAEMMLLATDITVERGLKKAVQTHQAEQAQRVAAMRRLIGGGAQVFLSFVESARSRLRECKQLLDSVSALLPIEAIDELFRQAHTIRSEARAFGLTELERTTDALERELDQLRARARGNGHELTPSLQRTLQSSLDGAMQALDRECQVLVAASPLGGAVLDRVTVSRSALLALGDYAAKSGGELGLIVERLLSVAFGALTEGVLESAPRWAVAQGNRVQLSVEGRELPVPAALARALPGILSHLVRNAIAHGIEDETEREAAGKSPHGQVRIAAALGAAGPSVRVSDDGRGLQVAAILERGGEHANLPAHELIFRPGLSTRAAPDQLAGRGVGLDAVRHELDALGYTVQVASEPGRGTTVTLTPKRSASTRAGSA